MNTSSIPAVPDGDGAVSGGARGWFFCARAREDLAVAALVSGLLAGCAAPPLIFEHPASRQRVDCTAQAERLAARQGDERARGYGPPRRETPAHLRAWDYKHRCAAEMTGAGFVCVSGC